MNATQAQQIAEKAIETVNSSSDYEYVVPFVTLDVWSDKFGYSVSYNGNEVGGLNRASAISLIVKQLLS